MTKLVNLQEDIAKILIDFNCSLLNYLNKKLKETFIIQIDQQVKEQLIKDLNNV